MPVQVTSTTDNAETVTAANAEKAADKVVEKTDSASSEVEDETAEESETSEESTEGDGATDADEDSDEESEQKEKPKKKNGFKKRIDKLTGKLTAKEQEVEYWRAKAMNGSQAPENKVVSKEVVSEGKPKKEDFESVEEYYEALTDWKVDQKANAWEAKQRESQVKTQHQSKMQVHQAKMAEFAKSHKDFDQSLKDHMEEHGNFVVAPSMESLILESEVGPEIVYEFVKNREELDRLNNLPPLAAARELGKIEARLSKKTSGSEPKEEKKPKPAPLKPLGANTSGSGKKSIYDPDISQKEYDRLRAEQLKKRA